MDLLFHLLLLLLKLLMQLLHLQDHDSQIFFAHAIQFRRRKLLHGVPPGKFSYLNYTTKQLFSTILFRFAGLFLPVYNIFFGFIFRIVGGNTLSGHEPLKLFLSHFHDFLLCPGPLVSAIQKPLVEQKESVSFPDETLDFIRLPAAEHEQDILLEWINIQLATDDRTQTVETLTKIRIATGNVDPVKAGGIIQHGALPAVLGQEQTDLHP